MDEYVFHHTYNAARYQSYFNGLGHFDQGEILMNNLFRGALAGAAAWKLGGGLISTIFIFVLVFWLLGKC